MYCYKCGNKIEDNAKFCTYCGVSLENDTNNRPRGYNNNNLVYTPSQPSNNGLIQTSRGLYYDASKRASYDNDNPAFRVVFIIVCVLLVLSSFMTAFHYDLMNYADAASDKIGDTFGDEWGEFASEFANSYVESSGIREDLKSDGYSFWDVSVGGYVMLFTLILVVVGHWYKEIASGIICILLSGALIIIGHYVTVIAEEFGGNYTKIAFEYDKGFYLYSLCAWVLLIMSIIITVNAYKLKNA